MINRAGNSPDYDKDNVVRAKMQDKNITNSNGAEEKTSAPIFFEEVK